MLRRFWAIVVLLYTCLLSYSQNEGWQVYPAYSEAVQLEAAENYLYCVMRGSGAYNSVTGNLVRYDTEDGSVKAYDSLHDLTYKEISRISYNWSSGCLVILYTNGSIDLLDADDNVTNVSALYDKSIMGENVIDIVHDGTMAYLLTNNSFIGLDVADGVVRDTYNLSVAPNSVQILNGRVYVARKDGLFMVESISLMRDQNRWQKIGSISLKSMCAFAGQLYALDGRNTVTYIIPTESGANIRNTSYGFSRLEAFRDVLICTDWGATIGLYFADAPQQLKIIKQRYTWNDKTMLGTDLYAAQTDTKVVHQQYDIDSNTFQMVSEESLFRFDSPRRDKFYNMSMEGGRLLVAGGINTWASNTPVTFMMMEEDGADVHWTVFDEDGVKERYPRLLNHNAVHLVQDPRDDTHFYGSVGGNGLHEYRLNSNGEVEFVELYNYQNSPLCCVDVKVADPWNYCTCGALKYDSNGNLWMANQFTDTIVRLIRPNGKWLSLYYPEIDKVRKIESYLFSKSGVNFCVIPDGSAPGFFGFDTNGTLNVVDDDRRRLRTTVTNQDGTSVVPTNFYCMAEDQDNEIWCGTSEGLFVITEPQKWFDSDFTFHQIKRNRNDGSGYADYFLSGTPVTSIVVDPSNRKWIGTGNDGVYLVSPDAQETIHHFTTDNSPLFSNTIRCIAVNPSNGRVYIGTDLGLCSYDENVSQPENVLTKEHVLAFPNPVKPNTDAVVTIQGLTEGAEVKIVSASGQVVWGAKSTGGRVLWNCCDNRGERVSSGVYHVVCNTKDAGVTVVTRIVVLR